MGISTSRLCDRRAYRGRIDGEYRMRAPSVASRSRTRGWRTATGPMPVMISRSGRWPWRTTRCWPVSVLRSVCFARNSATSASMAWVSNARAPLRRISVRESVKAPGWASLMTLLSDTAYHSFIGEVEALNTTTIRRLTRSRRHQLLAIAQEADHLQGFKEKAAPLIENTLAVLELGDDLYRPDLAASNAGVAGIFGDTEPTFQSSGLRSADMAGDAFDLWVVKSVNDDFVVRPEQSELCAEGASGATLWSVEDP